MRESSAATKRSFLERKGLTSAEIDEAFKRVPEPAPSNLAPSSTLTPTGLITYQNQTTAPGQAVAQPAVAAATYPAAGGVAGAPQYQTAIVPVQPQAVVPAAPVQEPLRWTQVLIGVGAVAAGVYAIRALVLPHVTEWYASWCERSRQQKEAQERHTQLMLEAAEALKACQAEMKVSTEAMTECLTTLRAETQRQHDAARERDHSSMMKSDVLLSELIDIKTLLQQQQRQNAPGNTTTLGSYLGEERLRRPGATFGSGSGGNTSYNNGTVYHNGVGGNRVTYDRFGGRSTDDDGPVYPGGSRGAIAPPPGGYLGAGGGGYSSHQGTVQDRNGGGWGIASPQQETAAQAPAFSNGGGSAGKDKEKAAAGGVGAGGMQGEYPPSFHEVRYAPYHSRGEGSTKKQE